MAFIHPLRLCRVAFASKQRRVRSGLNIWAGLLACLLQSRAVLAVRLGLGPAVCAAVPYQGTPLALHEYAA